MTANVYDTLASPIVKKCLAGYNGTIFAYGQTSSGKTYTMSGADEAKGIIQMTIDEIFNEIQKSSDDKSFTLSVGYIEIYKEKIYDLLSGKRTKLRVFDFQGETQTNQREFHVNSKDEIIKYLEYGNRMRKVATTMQNDNSSRSHVIFRITIESKDINDEVKISNLLLVDLAGSEKPDVTKDSFNEGLFINKSLLALGKIIRQLTEKNSNHKKVRYRESLLTRLLSSSLGGNSFTSIICTVSPTSLDETFYTLW